MFESVAVGILATNLIAVLGILFAIFVVMAYLWITRGDTKAREVIMWIAGGVWLGLTLISACYLACMDRM